MKIEKQKTVDKNDLFTVKDVSERKGFLNRLESRLGFLLNKNFSETEQEYYNRQNAITWLKENTKYGGNGLYSLDVNGNMKNFNLLWPFFKMAVWSAINFIFLMKFLSSIQNDLFFAWEVGLMIIILLPICFCGLALVISYQDLKKEKEGSFFKNKIDIFKRVLNGEEISVQELYEKGLIKIPGEKE